MDTLPLTALSPYHLGNPRVDVIGEGEMLYSVPLEIKRQDDDLWRVQCPHLKGCWVDAATLEEALAQIQEVAAMVLDLYQEKGWPLPKELTASKTGPVHAVIPVQVKGVGHSEKSRATPRLSKAAR